MSAMPTIDWSNIRPYGPGKFSHVIDEHVYELSLVGCDDETGNVQAVLDTAQHLFNQLYAAGVDYDDVVETLEREGIEKFVASFNELLQGIADKRERLTAAA